ncbi:hypothetical protein FYJ52_01600 [Eubacteriaceae bacterium RF-744-FAT-4]|uniref:RNA-binding S4 domain-containing protein n=2 Tax=Pseudoramibacter porci TaxID=2606631 RepID=A0A7X2NES2_9FIRM|nr:hypothetical protein [Pseudoramibacter porci]
MNDFMNEKKENVVLSRIEDAVYKQDRLYFFDFYDEAMQAKIEMFLQKNKAHYVLDGGFPDAARKKLCVIPTDWISFIDPKKDIDWPMMAVRFPRNFAFAHRHVLGTLMGLGIEHKCIGDINLDEDECQVIFDEKIYPFLKNEFVSIRGRSINPQYFDYQHIRPFALKTKNLVITVNSPRIDAVIDRIWGISRQTAEAAVRQSRVRVNYTEITKKDFSVKAGDIISFRGKGKAKIAAFIGKSKKGKIQIQVEKYL